MKSFSVFMSESTDVKTYLKYLPGPASAVTYNKSYVNRVTGKTVPESWNWSKSGGQAGAKSVDASYDKAIAAGFKKISNTDNSTPDGSRVGNQKMLDKDGIVMVFSSSYGNTAAQNRFTVTVYNKSQ